MGGRWFLRTRVESQLLLFFAVLALFDPASCCWNSCWRKRRKLNKIFKRTCPLCICLPWPQSGMCKRTRTNIMNKSVLLEFFLPITDSSHIGRPCPIEMFFSNLLLRLQLSFRNTGISCYPEIKASAHLGNVLKLWEFEYLKVAPTSDRKARATTMGSILL